MKNKWFVGLGVVVLALGIGTAAYAESNQMTVQDMLPFMKQTQPQVTNNQSNEKYQDSDRGDDSETLYNWESLIIGTQIGLIR
ncbi:hypothetical protein [Paenibacillus sp. GCM10028914]|uniref:hypothetical protein n=1 Tax=Paenibacillus sp. GCM10028914 TaxID=3273416 RepID=UPI003607D5C1